MKHLIRFFLTILSVVLPYVTFGELIPYPDVTNENK